MCFGFDVSMSSRQRSSEQRHWTVFLYVADLTVTPFKSEPLHVLLL